MLESLSAAYLYIPVILFILGWVKPIIAIPVVAALLYSLFVFKRNIHKGTTVSAPVTDRKYTVLIILILIGWVFISGVGGFVWQNTWDHKFRNALFNDLVAYPWPVINGDTGLCYYIGFWIPAALVGKLFSVEVGYFFQTIWASIGVILAVFLVFKYLGKQKIGIVILFIFFSGLDVLLYVGKGIIAQRGLVTIVRSLLQGEHLELIARYFNSSSNTTLLFWLYNQIIPFWVGFMTILVQKKNKGVFFIYATMFFFCPFPCISLFPVILYIFLKNQVFCNGNNLSAYSAIKKLLSVENLVLLPTMLILALYYTSNIAVNKLGILPLGIPTIAFFLASFIVEFGVYLLFVYRENKHDPILNILLVTTVICSFIVMGNSYDFAWRTCIPLSFYIMLLVAKRLMNTSFPAVARTCLLLLLLAGAFTPTTEFLRTARMEHYVFTGLESARSDSLSTVFTRENNECYENFIGDRNSHFFNHLCR